MVAFLLAACDTASDDGIRIVGTRPDEPAVLPEQKPVHPPGPSGTSPEAPIDDECTPAPPTGAGDDLPMSFCRRVSPEGPPACGTYRCTLYNLLGAVGLVGTPTGPVVQYCDSDPDGGLRVGTYDPAVDTMLAPALLPWRTCESSWGNGAFATADGGAIEAYWSTLELDEGGATFTYVLWSATYDATAGVYDDPAIVPGAPEPMFVERANGGPSVLFLVGPDGLLSALVPATGASAALGTSDGRVAATATAADAIVAACAGGLVRVHAVGAGGQERWERTVAGSACVDALGPAVAAAEDGTLLVAWTEADRSRAAVFAPDGTELGRIDLGTGIASVGPAAASAAGHFLVVDGLGVGAVLDGTGAVTRTFHHAGIALRPAENREIRVLWDGADAAFALAMEFTEIVATHANTHDELEVSGAPIAVAP